MQKIKNIEEIISNNSKIRNASKESISNFFCSKEKITLWINKGDCFIEKQGNTLFVIKKSAEFWNVFYSSISIYDLRKDISSFRSLYNKIHMSIDVVGFDFQCQPIVDLLLGVGFNVAKSLVRMTKKTDVIEYKTDNTVRCAHKEDIFVISKLLHTFFNEETEQIPYDEELISYANQGHVFVCEENNYIVGFLIYDITPSTLYLRYLFTNTEFRHRKVASRIP